MAKYAVDFQRTASTTGSAGTVVADSTRPRRIKWYDIMFGSEATPADAALLFTAQRCSAAGTGSAVTPQPLDPADAATEADAAENHTIEPTYTAGGIMLNIPVNQRATFRWACSPGAEIVTPATAANGLGIQTDTISTGTPVITVQAHVEEQ